MLNVIEFTVIVRIIYNYVTMIIKQMSNKPLNFTFLYIKIFLNWKKTFSSIS